MHMFCDPIAILMFMWYIHPRFYLKASVFYYYEILEICFCSRSSCELPVMISQNMNVKMADIMLPLLCTCHFHRP